mmetsp:Transcript_46228/g.122550  ORF Transcript_46228/g.122550 Transcript_46228/m.122550 type:complete len:312 (-) Transcript_46228:525-1460(-)
MRADVVYPQKRVTNVENKPTVWVGCKDDVEERNLRKVSFHSVLHPEDAGHLGHGFSIWEFCKRRQSFRHGLVHQLANEPPACTLATGTKQEVGSGINASIEGPVHRAEAQVLESPVKPLAARSWQTHHEHWALSRSQFDPIWTDGSPSFLQRMQTGRAPRKRWRSLNFGMTLQRVVHPLNSTRLGPFFARNALWLADEIHLSRRAALVPPLNSCAQELTEFSQTVPRRVVHVKHGAHPPQSFSHPQMMGFHPVYQLSILTPCTAWKPWKVGCHQTIVKVGVELHSPRPVSRIAHVEHEAPVRIGNDQSFEE